MLNHGWTYSDKIKDCEAGMSALEFYSGRYSHSSRQTWEERLRNGEMTIGGVAIGADRPLSAGETVLWHRPPWEEGEVPRDFQIIYEDDDIIAVDKPAGLPVLPNGGFLENTLVAFLGKIRPETPPVPAHRLNRGTSGLILFSKTANARRDLAAQFRDKTARRSGEMVKIYHARTKPFLAASAGYKVEITTPVGKVPHPILGTVYAASETGLPSCSRCEILSTDSESTLWKVDLVTGRPHQIRIHLASIGYPLLGEPLFLPGGHPRPDALPGDCGYQLRSISLLFRHPATGRQMMLKVEE